MKVILLRAAITVVVAMLLPLPYPLFGALGMSINAFVAISVPIGLLLVWLLLDLVEPRVIPDTRTSNRPN
jgi:hypothetical protein